jgi:hypothetical protein
MVSGGDILVENEDTDDGSDLGEPETTRRHLSASAVESAYVEIDSGIQALI